MKKHHCIVRLAAGALTLLLTVSGCVSEGEQGTAAVQSVSMLCGFGNPGLAQRFAGVISSRGEVTVTPDESKEIQEVLVEEGDTVQEGQTLLTYDAELIELEIEKAELELEQLKGSLAAKEKEKTDLEVKLKKAPASEQLSYTLAVSECETAIRELNYNLSLKQRSLDFQRESMETMEVVAPISGRIQKMNPDGGYDNYGNPLPFMTIVEEGEYRVKGMINENNVGSLVEGESVVIRSRRDTSRTWNGYLSMIDWENPQSSNNGYYYGVDDGMNSSSRYPFYVELDNAEGLLLGEHVYIEPFAEEAGEQEIALAASFLMDIDGSSAYVWKENESGKLAKEKVELGDYYEINDLYVIVSGLSLEDYIAFPEEGLKAGMTCTEYDAGLDSMVPEPEEGMMAGEME